MLLIVDTNVLIAQLLRARGIALLLHTRLLLAVTERVWQETLHELVVRLSAMQRQRQLSDEAIAALHRLALDAMRSGLEVIPLAAYQAQETVARRRVPRDPDDWSTVAAALALDVGIWTNDADFLGCGCPTWTTDTLLAELAS